MRENALSYWRTLYIQKGMAELFGCTTDNISQQLKRIFSEGELVRESVTEKISATALKPKRSSTPLKCRLLGDPFFSGNMR